MNGDALVAKSATSLRGWGLHGEAGLYGLGSCWVHYPAAGLVVEEPGLTLVDGGAVHDGDGQEVVAIVRVVDLHELSGCPDGDFFICDGLFEVIG